MAAQHCCRAQWYTPVRSGMAHGILLLQFAMKGNEMFPLLWVDTEAVEAFYHTDSSRSRRGTLKIWWHCIICVGGGKQIRACSLEIGWYWYWYRKYRQIGTFFSIGKRKKLPIRWKLYTPVNTHMQMNDTIHVISLLCHSMWLSLLWFSGVFSFQTPEGVHCS